MSCSARKLVLAIGIATALCAPAVAFDLEVNRTELEIAFTKYTECNSGCAKELALQIGDESVEEALETVGIIEGTKSKKISKKLKVLGFYAFMRSAFERGKEIVNANNVCANQCDALNKEIVTLGRAGLLGPMLRGEEVNSEALSKPEIWDAYLKFVKPIELPAEHKGDEWWKYIQSLS